MENKKCLKPPTSIGLHRGFGFFATVTGVFGYGAMLEGFFATGNARGFIATVQKVFLRRLGMFFATVNE